MKRTLTFIPLGIGISAAIIYVFNIISYRIINDSVALSQILSNLKVYLYISIIGFVVYFILRILIYMTENKKEVVVHEKVKEVKIESNDDVIQKQPKIVIENDNAYEPVEFKTTIAESKSDNVAPVKLEVNNTSEDSTKTVIKTNEKVITNEVKSNDIYVDDKYCPNCGQRIRYVDRYCSNCGKVQYYRRKDSLLRKIINVIEIVVMLLIIYFLLNMMFEYKEKTDSTFRSPFKVSMTK